MTDSELPETNRLPDFDTLVDMAENDPERLEALRSAMVEHVIGGADVRRRRRLEGVQAQVDLIREGSPNALAACVRISRMMRDSLEEMRHVLSGTTASVEGAASKGEVVPFPRTDG